jgi:mRNA interferase RelE/StbE
MPYASPNQPKKNSINYSRNNLNKSLKIFSLQENPLPQDFKLLKGKSDFYRVDQGEFRILYTIAEDEVQIFRVGKRNDDEVYRNL